MGDQSEHETGVGDTADDTPSIATPSNEGRQLSNATRQSTQSTSAETQQTSADSQSLKPNNEIRQPSSQTQQHSSQTREHSTETRQPSSQTRQPSSQTRQPSSQTRQPSNQARQPSNQARQPSSQTRQPSNQARQPSSQARQMSTDAAQQEGASGAADGRKRDYRHTVLESLGITVGNTLGHGSYASVKSAYDAKKKEEVAIKIVSRRRAPQDYLAKFLPREIEVLKVLRHPSLITFFQVIETTNRIYIVMEIAHKGDLLDAIRNNMYIQEYQSRRWFKQLQDGITYIHSKGVAHRDIKCENLLLDKNNDIKITDFGFAKRIFPVKSVQDVLSETYCGSYAYASPEILKGIAYDPFISEVWSMGVVLYTMVFGRLPYDDSDLRRLLKQVQRQVVFPAQPEVSNECKKLLLKVLVHHRDRVPLDEIPHQDWFKVDLPEPKVKVVPAVPRVPETPTSQPSSQTS